MSDMISRQASIELIHSLYPSEPILQINRKRWKKKYKPYIEAEKALEMFPSAEPDRDIPIKPISYMDCANALLRMWMDNVLTDGEYNRIMDKLNAHERKEE